ncbi:Hypothetical protein A7982_10199 [Minicystis rosea]|nr:Hypothetical protein A7982_10199 [Minicystis rosea]
MSSIIESHGDIEVFVYPSGSAATRASVPFFDSISVGDRLSLVFNPGDEANPPFALKIVSPSGTTIMDTILRDLPTGMPQSPPPVEFVVSARGIYKIEIRELKGRQRGEAKLKVG